MNAGELRDRVAIQRRTMSVDAAGGAVESWSTSATRWARIEPQGGSEAVNADRVLPSVTHRVTFRWESGLVLPRDRIVFGTRTLNVEAVTATDERHLEIVCMCREAQVA